eukprot:4654771-Amphidinium_carterae.1
MNAIEHLSPKRCVRYPRPRHVASAASYIVQSTPYKLHGLTLCNSCKMLWYDLIDIRFTMIFMTYSGAQN